VSEGTDHRAVRAGRVRVERDLHAVQQLHAQGDRRTADGSVEALPELPRRHGRSRMAGLQPVHRVCMKPRVGTQASPCSVSTP
jgi:hypothetical protein